MAKSHWGQNFLTDPFFVDDLVTAGGVTNKDVVLEIGAGEGEVTRELIKTAKKVYAIEIDPRLIPILTTNLKPQIENGKLQIINEDALRVLSDSKKILSLEVTKFVGSIPYQITSPFIHFVVNNFRLPAALLIQKEVAERLTAKPPRATYLSNYIANWGEGKLIRIVPKEVFNPIPKVDGTIVALAPHTNPKVDTIKFSHFLHRGFSNPRKMLNKVFAKDLLLGLGIDPTRRAETLDLEEWKKLYEAHLPKWGLGKF